MMWKLLSLAPLFSLAIGISAHAQGGPDRGADMVRSTWNGDLLACPERLYKVNGKMMPLESWSEDATRVGDIETGSIEPSYEDADAGLNVDGFIEKEITPDEAEYMASLRPVFKANFNTLAPALKDSLTGSCLKAPERLAQVIAAQEATRNGRLQAGNAFKKLEAMRKRNDSRPDYTGEEGNPKDPRFFQVTNEAIWLMYARDGVEEYACALTKSEARMDGIRQRLEQGDPHEVALTGNCEIDRAKAATVPSYGASGISGDL